MNEIILFLFQSDASDKEELKQYCQSASLEDLKTALNFASSNRQFSWAINIIKHEIKMCFV